MGGDILDAQCFSTTLPSAPHPGLIAVYDMPGNRSTHQAATAADKVR
ncbi:hypothetical protein XBKB1_940038 [Xenorhabdus bovienii str. kraussei Becker Underwood]|uniref:Uncharacterized protein n=1 Tax=Xenorhabdus bovienii str. kraussei Becker Underwood TaxID=1398204 RepID=A0A077Q3Z5_XENBV|nr:hypothetical protein XBKB1_940038 [Xenorhabdus bovienii str. kraussei Becker Underwood]